MPGPTRDAATAVVPASGPTMRDGRARAIADPVANARTDLEGSRRRLPRPPDVRVAVSPSGDARALLRRRRPTRPIPPVGRDGPAGAPASARFPGSPGRSG